MDTASETKGKTLLQRINEVRKNNDYIKKDKSVQGGGYMAVTHDKVTAELRKDLIEQGVLIFPSIVAGTHRVIDTGTKTAKGVPFIRLEADVAVTFVNVDDKDDRETIILPAHAIDQGDKAPGKLISYAVKYALLKVFNIETGEDDEGRHVERDGANVMDKKEIDGFKVKVDATGTEDQLTNLWKGIIVPRCREVGDQTAYTILQAYVTVRMARIKGVKVSTK